MIVDNIKMILQYRKTIIGTVTLIPLLGVTWLIGIFSINAQTTLFAWLFVICASSQVH